MDLSSSFLSYSTQSWSSPSSDSDIYNISSPEAASPSNYSDFSPGSRSQDTPATLRSAIPRCVESRMSVGKQRTRTRSKNPSKQRQNASEKEKLRMRDLTKALHHLRTYLPPSVAPAGQTLTKIETLRLTIRYISYLSSQLGQEPLSQRSDLSPPYSGICHYSSVPEAWRPASGAETHTQDIGHLGHTSVTTAEPQNEMDVDIFGSMLEYPLYPETSFSCQDYSKAAHYQSLAPAFWS
ncbi:mesoderm posterior bb [Astyanax mexicanus]|uniref:mesoderm posterior bb n=1 Tax=Astyanax mexicanus TaxID=7994 RepID=UPI0020CAE657|nr:mesoderm posterior bb [Astyanax mexicanus]